MALIALTVLSALGFYMAMNAVTEVRISDNYESHVQAREAALAGINHSREALRGLAFDDCLKGPDGTYSSAPAYMASAHTFAFRNLTDWGTSRTLNIFDPTSAVIGLTDDGLINTGKVGGTPGTVIIPKTGIAFTAPNPYGAGTITTARYFVKATDNNGEASELAGDSTDNPFIDGDGTIIVRSVGVARTVSENLGNGGRRNSTAVYEARFQLGIAFDMVGSPVVVIGSDVDANFSGNAFDIVGGTGGPGVATIDIGTGDSYQPDVILRTATNGKGHITGNCIPNQNCIADITATVSSNPAMSFLKDPVWWDDFVNNQVPQIADNIWNGSGSIDLGTPQNPKITLVGGNLSMTGGGTGAGLLVVKGDLALGGSIVWDGLVIVMGTGSFWTHGMNRGIHGGVIVGNLTKPGGVPTFGTPSFDIRGNSDITTYDNGLLKRASGLLPLRQISLREVTSMMDP